MNRFVGHHRGHVPANPQAAGVRWLPRSDGAIGQTAGDPRARFLDHLERPLSPLGNYFTNGEIHHGGLRGRIHSLDANQPTLHCQFLPSREYVPSGEPINRLPLRRLASRSAELTRLSTGTSAESSAMANLPEYQFVDNLRPPGSQCERPLILTRIAPEEPGYDLRTYFCAACYASETVIAPIARKLGPEI
jgi:hypothetical protein